MLLQNKNAVLYGAAGAIGSAVAHTFAREGARVFLTGRTLAPLETLATAIVRDGGSAEATQVDALDERAIREHADAVAKDGGIDVSFNAIGIDHIQGMPLTELSPEQFSLPIATYTTSHFLTTTTAARHMLAKNAGVILTLSTTAARVAMSSDGFGPACAAIEALSRQLAGELGPHGIRVICLRPDAIPETVARGSHAQQVWRRAAERVGMTLDQMLEGPLGVPGSLLSRSPTLDELANVAAFMASDRSSGMTAAIANVTCGSLVD